jgi:hypothetical protein
MSFFFSIFTPLSIHVSGAILCESEINEVIYSSSIAQPVAMQKINRYNKVTEGYLELVARRAVQMAWLKGIFISIAVLVLIGLGGYVVYNVAYGLGEVEGYDKGCEDGYSVGEKAGYEEGYSSGKRDGYSEGYGSGKATGYEEGYDEGVGASLGHSYTLCDPTYEEALAFLEQDRTNNNEFVKGTYGIYVCSHFARDVCNNAEKEGLRCALVELRYMEDGHAVIAFDTIDEGLVYFDPQTDERARPVIGKRYYQCIEPKPGYYYEEPPHDDTIMDILVIW